MRGLNFVNEVNDVIHIGALTTYAEMLDSPLLHVEAEALVQAAAVVGSPQTRNRGTLGGNVANASPAGDTLPPLLAFNAEVTFISSQGNRTLPLVDLLVGPGKTAMSPEEVIRQVSFEKLPSGTKSVFLRLGTRQGMAVSIASTAVVLRLDREGIVEDVRIALGAVAPTAIRCFEVETELTGQLLTPDLIEKTTRMTAQACSPIDDIRGTADYRRHAVKHLVKRAIYMAVEKSQNQDTNDFETNNN